MVASLLPGSSVANVKALLQCMKTQSYRLFPHAAVMGADPQLVIHMSKEAFAASVPKSAPAPARSAGSFSPCASSPRRCSAHSAQESRPQTWAAKLGQINTDKVVLMTGKKLLEKCSKQMCFKIFVLSAIMSGTPQYGFKCCLRLHLTFYIINY